MMINFLGHFVCRKLSQALNFDLAVSMATASKLLYDPLSFTHFDLASGQKCMKLDESYSTLLRGVFLVCMERKRPEFLCESKFLVL